MATEDEVQTLQTALSTTAAPQTPVGPVPVSQPPDSLTPVNMPIASSEGFTSEDVTAFLCSQSGTIIVLLGDRDSGKSTLICSIYDRFLHGPFAACDSCGIRTVVGLERRAHLERTESGRIIPEMQHTSIAEGLQYFHFPVVASGGDSRRQDLLISDRAGELYKNARGNSELVNQLTELQSADYVVVLLDGARLVEPSTRAGALYAVRQSLQMLLDCAAMNRTYRVQIVTTKSDVITKSPDADSINERLKAFESRTLSDFASRLASLKFYTIAARDPEGSFDPAFGVDVLIRTWLDGPKSRDSIVVPTVEISTEFDKLSIRPEGTEESAQ